MYRSMIQLPGSLAAALLVCCSCTKQEDPASASYAKDVEQMQMVKKQDPKSRVLAFYFPMDVNADRVVLLLNGVRIRTTYNGSRRMAHRGDHWMCQVLVTSDVESGKAVIDGRPLEFSVKLNDIESVYFVEVFKDAAKGGFNLYQGTQPRGGGYI